MNKPIQLEAFNGPLDLLLQLIEQKELEITSISISQVTEQFLEYLQEIEERFPEELADFLVIATKLLLLKSQALLPYLQIEEEEDPGNLEAQLRMYKKYAEATHGIDALLREGRELYARKEWKQQEARFAPPEGLEADDLKQFFVDVLSRLEPVVRIPKAALQKVVTLREKFVQIQELLAQHATLQFQELLADSEDRGEIVVTFLALLELIKKQQVAVVQEKPLDTIVIEKV